jgi:hypothetical protein
LRCRHELLTAYFHWITPRVRRFIGRRVLGCRV